MSDLGVDSLMSLELCDAISGGTGVPLRSTSILDHPTINDLACHLLAELGFPVQDAA
jgi:acyl carrier protein